MCMCFVYGLLGGIAYTTLLQLFEFLFGQRLDRKFCVTGEMPCLKQIMVIKILAFPFPSFRAETDSIERCYHSCSDCRRDYPCVGVRSTRLNHTLPTPL